jgi:hypothetical protein
MKVYVVIGGCDLEGLDLPDKVFSTKEAAEEHAEKMEKTRPKYDFVDIFHYELDV